jgi:hypothetical protein
MTDEIENARSAHRHGRSWNGSPPEKRWPLWPVVLVLCVVWWVLIVAVKWAAGL